MTVALWRIAATTSRYVADDLSGAGAKNTGGRWNPTGIAVTYSSENIALAVHETVVHLRSGGLPLNRYLVRIDVPDDVWTARQTLAPSVGWDALPAGMISMQAGRGSLAGEQGVRAADSALSHRAGGIERADQSAAPGRGAHRRHGCAEVVLRSALFLRNAGDAQALIDYPRMADRAR